MPRILRIALRDYLATVRTRGFLIGLVVAPLIFGGGAIGIALMNVKLDLSDRKVAIVDSTGSAAFIAAAGEEKSALEATDPQTGKRLRPRYVFETLAPAADHDRQLLELSERVRHHELAAFLEVLPESLEAPLQVPADSEQAKQSLLGKVRYYDSGGAVDEVQGWLAAPVSAGILRARLARLGVAPARQRETSAAVGMQVMTLLDRDPASGAVRSATRRNAAAGLVPLGIMMLMMMIVMVGAAPTLQAVMEDKSQRLIEMLLGVATPFEIMGGKVLGALAISLTGLVFYLGAAITAVTAMGAGGILPMAVIPWFILYVIADVLVLCGFAAALGSLCSTPQEAQSLAMVQLAPVLIPMFLMTTVMRSPNGAFSTAVSLLPPFTPMLMLMRQATPGGVPAWQPWVGLAGIIVWTLGGVWVAARIFRIGILMQGKAPNLKEVVRWVRMS